MARSDVQLSLIAEVVDVAARAGIPIWLRGGWALDLFLGEVTRAHEDVDLFAWADDAGALVSALAAAGYDEIGGPPPAEQRNLEKAGEELHVTLLAQNPEGRVVTAGGRWDTTPWPDGMLGADRGRIGGVDAPIVSPASQLEVKESYATVVPERPLRAKDRGDIERLRAALACCEQPRERAGGEGWNGSVDAGPPPRDATGS